jgi:hypothetical protein
MIILKMKALSSHIEMSMGVDFDFDKSKNESSLFNQDEHGS